jgi:hypothetical protein
MGYTMPCVLNLLVTPRVPGRPKPPKIISLSWPQVSPMFYLCLLDFIPNLPRTGMQTCPHKELVCAVLPLLAHSSTPPTAQAPPLKPLLILNPSLYLTLTPCLSPSPLSLSLSISSTYVASSQPYCAVSTTPLLPPLPWKSSSISENPQVSIDGWRDLLWSSSQRGRY